jgi:hypothetical protein
MIKLSNDLTNIEIKNLIFYICFDSKYSVQIRYTFWLNHFFAPRFLTKSTKTLTKKLKMTRFNLKYLNNATRLTGMYRAI